MVIVILRDGRVLKYNQANYVTRHEGDYTLRTKEGESYFIAFIPMDMVERIETVKPCQILKENRNKKKMPTY